jgi:hypothetical protein
MIRGKDGHRRHANIPESWLRFKEAGDRVGVSHITISKWVRQGYLKGHRVGCFIYVDWNEAMQSRLFRNVHARFQASLEVDDPEEFVMPKKANARPFAEELYT